MTLNEGLVDTVRLPGQGQVPDEFLRSDSCDGLNCCRRSNVSHPNPIAIRHRRATDGIKWLLSAKAVRASTSRFESRTVRRNGRRVIAFFLWRTFVRAFGLRKPSNWPYSSSRAAVDRRGQNRISALASEIVAANDNAFVIADGVGGVERAITFQSMKEQNGFAERDISIVLTCLNPEKFAELNDRHYDDQLNQAVGRNRGFRLSNRRSTITRVITTTRLWQQVLRKREDRNRRTNFISPRAENSGATNFRYSPKSGHNLVSR